MRVILGSQSKWRRALLRNAGIEAEGMAADIDEKAVTAGFEDRGRADASVLTVAIAKAKAEALLRQLPPGEEALLITCDQVTVHNGTIREKPESEQECREYLASYEHAPATTVSAVVVTNTKTGKQAHVVDIAQQYFTAIPADIVSAVIAKGDVMQCCGGFMVDDPLLVPFLGARVGTEESIMGLPVHVLPQLFKDVE